jgi:hypothetical protein
VLKVPIKLGLGLTVIAAMSRSSFCPTSGRDPDGRLGWRRNSAISPVLETIEGVNNARSDPSGLRNSLKVAAPLPPSISAPTVTTHHWLEAARHRCALFLARDD